MEKNDQDNEMIDLSDELKNLDAGVNPNGEENALDQVFPPETPKIVQWVIKYSGGLIQDEKQASYVLIGFIVVSATVLLFSVFGAVSETSESDEPGIEMFKNISPESVPRK